MRFLVPVVPGDRMEIDIKVFKLVQDIALIEGVVTVDGTLVPRAHWDSHDDHSNLRRL
jgi:3-hydroxymyristoyl/3-hydroxydecanoyl-(acyl carrier protein) dehydratase